MAIPKASLYDRYKLSNSSAIPMFEGSNGPESIQVASHLQGIYDTASQGAADIGDAVNNVQALGPDQSLAKELQDNIHSKIDEYSKAGNWEDMLPQVRSLGRQYAARSAELYQPVQQFNEWQKGLENKDLNLTPYQKDSLKSMALSNYQGLRKDPSGKLVGKFDSPEIAKNVDVNKKVDEWMKDIAIQKGGSEIANVNGEWKIKKGNNWETLAPGTIERTLNDAMANDNEFMAHVKQEGDIAGYNGMKAVRSMDQLAPAVQQIVKDNIAKGYPLRQSVQAALATAQQQHIMNTAKDYAVTKYQYNKRVTSSDIEDNPNYWKEREEKAKAQNGIFGDVVTGGGIDVSKYNSADDIETNRTAAVKDLERAGNEIGAAKNVIAAKLGTAVDNLTDKQIQDYYAKYDPAGLGKYKSNLQAMQSNQSSIDEADQIRTAAMDLATRKKNPGLSYDELQKTSTDNFQKTAKGLKLVAEDGTKITDPSKYTVIDGAQHAFGDNYVELKDRSTGKVLKLITAGQSGDNANDNDKLTNIAGKFNGINWKDTWKDAATNIRSNSMWMPLLNKSTPDGQTTKAGEYETRVKSVLEAGSGGLNVKNADFGDIKGDDAQEMRDRIASGKFEVKGIGKVKADGKMYVQLSVQTSSEKDEPDPAKRFKTIVVGVESNVANKLAGYAVDAGRRDNDIRTYQFGRAMAPNSGYEQVLNMGSTGRLQITEKGIASGRGGNEIVQRPTEEVVPNITGSSSDAMTYEVYKLDSEGKRTGQVETFNDAFDLGAYLDAHKDAGRTIVKKTK